jgi:hypothetical protein
MLIDNPHFEFLTAHPPPWRDTLDPREAAELVLAELYAERFHHGTDGHHRLMLIAKLAKLLDNTGTRPLSDRPPLPTQ